MNYAKVIPQVRLVLEEAVEKVNIRNSETAVEVLRDIWKEDCINTYECFFALYLNRANDAISWHKISQGGIAGTVIDTKLILKGAIECTASSIIVAHNHPSGNTQPSDADIKITKRIKESAALMDIKLLDHVILTDASYLSFADEGLI